MAERRSAAGEGLGRLSEWADAHLSLVRVSGRRGRELGAVPVRPGVAERRFYLISPQSLSAGVAVAGLLVLARSVRLVSAARRGCGAPGPPFPHFPQPRNDARLPRAAPSSAALRRAPCRCSCRNGAPCRHRPPCAAAASGAIFPVPPPRLRCVVTRLSFRMARPVLALVFPITLFLDFIFLIIVLFSPIPPLQLHLPVAQLCVWPRDQVLSCLCFS